MAGTLSPVPWFQFLDENGHPYAGAKLFTYLAGTTTKQPTYTDATLSVPHPNPIILDSAGRATVYLAASSYKFVLAPSSDKDPPLSPYRTQDNISAVPATQVNLDVAAIAGEALPPGAVVYLSDGSDGKVPGRWYLADADFEYASSQAPMVGMTPASVAPGMVGSVRLQGRITGLSGLTVGATYMVSTTAGALTATAPTNVKVVGVADTVSSLVLAPNQARSQTMPHAFTHQAGGSDALSVLALAGFPGGTATFLRADGAFASPVAPVVVTGTFVPFLSGTGGASGQAYVVQHGAYAKIDALVIVIVHLRLANKGTISGNIIVGGLPFAVRGDVVNQYSPAFCSFDLMASNFVTIHAFAEGGTTTAKFRGMRFAPSITNMNYLDPPDLSNSSEFDFTLVYFTT